MLSPVVLVGWDWLWHRLWLILGLMLLLFDKIDNLVNSAGFTENFDATNYPVDRMRKL